MQRLLILTFSVAFLTGAVINAAAKETQSKTENRQGQYQETLELVERGDFIFKARRAFPTGGRSIDLTTNYGFIEVSDSMAEAGLPFFGRAYNIRYGGRGGIRFSSNIVNLDISKNPDKMRIRYSFEVKDDDYYKVSMDIGYDGGASVSIISNKRSHIRYQGNLAHSDSAR